MSSAVRRSAISGGDMSSAVRRSGITAVGMSSAVRRSGITAVGRCPAVRRGAVAVCRILLCGDRMMPLRCPLPLACRRSTPLPS
jgi:hypothetical protein